MISSMFLGTTLTGSGPEGFRSFPLFFRVFAVFLFGSEDKTGRTVGQGLPTRGVSPGIRSETTVGGDGFLGEVSGL